MKPVKRTLSVEVLLLLLICVLDTVSSAWLFYNHLAVEGNPVLRGFADAGTIPFILAKTLTFLPALLVAQWYYYRRPHFVRPLLRGAVAVYCGIYFCMVSGQLVG